MRFLRDLTQAVEGGRALSFGGVYWIFPEPKPAASAGGWAWMRMNGSGLRGGRARRDDGRRHLSSATAVVGLPLGSAPGARPTVGCAARHHSPLLGAPCFPSPSPALHLRSPVGDYGLESRAAVC